MNRPQIKLHWWVVLPFFFTASITLSAQDVSDNLEDVYELSPFEVTTSEEEGYLASDTLAGTRVRTDLRDIASSISVVTSAFMKDTASVKAEELLIYTTNTEIGGVTGNFSGLGGSVTFNESSALLRPNTNTRVRGLDSADNTRNFFLTEIPWDGYNVERVDMQRGPNSILFGVGSPAGIINASINTADFTDKGKYENRIGSFGSLRNVLDYNKVLIDDELGVRVSLLHDETKYRQKPAFSKDKRVYAVVRYDPKMFGEDTYTSFKASYENGKVTSNRPRSLPPIDGITPWFATGESNGVANLNQITLNPLTTWSQYGDNYLGEPGMYSWFKEAFMGRLMSSNIANFYDAGSSTPINTMMPNIGAGNGVDSNGLVDGTIGEVPFARPWAITTMNNYARGAILGGKYYGNVSLTDDSIFDFYTKLIDGDNKREWRNWDAINASLQQTYLDSRMGWEFVYDSQEYDDGQIAFLQGDQYVVSVDINTHQMDGSINPNVGRPYVGNSGQGGNYENFIERENMRFTAFGDLRAKDFLGDSWLSRFLGHHVFTALFSKEVKKEENRQFARWASDPSYAEYNGNNTDITNGARQIDWIAYLGDSLLDVSSASGANLSAVNANIDPFGSTSVKYFDSRWNATGVDVAAPYVYTSYDLNGQLIENEGIEADNVDNYVGWTDGSYNVLSYDHGDVEDLYTQGKRSHNQIESKGFTWQGYLLDGNLVPVLGWRKDTVKNASTQAPKNEYDVSLLNYDIDRSDANTRVASGESKSWGAVLHTPSAWRAKLPGYTGVSLFYNSSENFKADAPRGDVFGGVIDNPYGKTKDYGFVLNTLDEKITLKVTWYKTEVSNATLSGDNAGFSSSLYYVWALPYWGATHALAALDGIANVRQGDWGWPWNGIAVDADGEPDNARIEEIVRDFFGNFPLDQNFIDQYGLDMNADAMHAAASGSFDAMWASVPGYGVDGQGASAIGLQPAYGGQLRDFGSAPVASVDTVSKGVEYELSAMITPQWNLIVNASKTTAQINSVSPTIQTWIDTYTEFVNGDAGLIKIWGGDTMRKVWQDQILAPYSVLQGQIGQQAPEVSPWRFNLVTNYAFNDGAFKGINIGAAYRWEDKRILGYQYDADADTLDIDKPWYGDTSSHVDLWAGYEREISSNIDWRIQINLRNVGEDVGLVAVSRNPDGSNALSRIQEGMIWSITNTFSF